MALDQDKIRKVLRKLGKSLQPGSRLSSPEVVRDLRTANRRLEAVIHAFRFDQQRLGNHLLKIMEPIRKKAGRVRDMDVLTEFVSGLAIAGEEGCLIHLLENLGAKRVKAVRELTNSIAKREEAVDRRLKRFSSLVQKGFSVSKNGASIRQQWQSEAMAVALQLSAELAAWPRLTAGNMHPYRIKVKELRDILQLAAESDTEFIDKLGEVKDAIGEWHDWNELLSIATEVLDHTPGCKVVPQIRSTSSAKFHHALLLSNTMQKKYLGSDSRPRSARNTRQSRFSQPVLMATTRLAG